MSFALEIYGSDKGLNEIISNYKCISTFSSKSGLKILKKLGHTKMSISSIFKCVR